QDLNPFIQNPGDYFKNIITLNWFGFSFSDTNNFYIKRNYENWVNNQGSAPHGAQLINGMVVDDTGLPLPGANVIVKGTTRGTQTDFDGYFEIYAAPNEELQFSYVGFGTTSTVVRA